MDYYRDIIDTICRTLAGKPHPAVLALLAEPPSAPSDDVQHSAGRFTFPSELLPSGTELRSLPDGEAFVDAATTASEETAADCIFMFPPLFQLRRYSAQFRERFRLIGPTEAAISESVAHAAPGVKAFLTLISPEILCSRRISDWRKDFFPDHSALVIEHDHGADELLGKQISPFARVCTVVFTRQPGPVRFFKITDAAAAGGKQRLLSDVARLIRQPAGKSQFGYVHQGPLSEVYPASFGFYSAETERLRKDVAALGEQVRLADVADVLMGSRPAHPESDADRATTGFLAIHARDITRDGRVDLSDLQPSERPAIVQRYLQDGDLCVRRIYHEGSGFVVGVYEGDGRSVTWNTNVIVVRPHASLSAAQRQVLLSFLRSPLAQKLGHAKQLTSSMGSHLMVSVALLEDFPVPLADKDITAALEDLGEARRAFEEWLRDIDDASNAIVQQATASGSRNVILQAGQLARQRYRAAGQVESLDYRIRTQFPHPLAYLWREVQVSGPDPYHRLRAITKAAEGSTCFLSQLCILLGRITGKPIAYLASLSARLRERSGGTNFGDWLAIVKEVTESRAFRDLETGTPLMELRALGADKAWEAGLRDLLDLRNDDSHCRISPASVSGDVLGKAEAALEVVYRATDFLTDYRLLLVTETRFDSIRQVSRFQYRDLSGDNALAPLHADTAQRNDLEAGSLYLRDRGNALWLLRPMLNYLECPQCHQMSTFYLDTYDSADGQIVGIKSFERSSVRHEPLADDFRHVGLVP
jgi:hypothetical protein